MQVRRVQKTDARKQRTDDQGDRLLVKTACQILPFASQFNPHFLSLEPCTFSQYFIELTNQPIQQNKLNQPQLESRRRSPFAEFDLAGGIFGDVLFQFFTPQRLKCPAVAIQRIDFGKIGQFAQQITKSNFTGGHTCIFRHFSLLRNTKPEYYFEIK